MGRHYIITLKTGVVQADILASHFKRMVVWIELRQFHQPILTLLEAYDNILSNNSDFLVGFYDVE